MATIDDAIEHLNAGRFEQADAMLRPLATRGDPDAMHLLGMLRDRAGDLEGAEALVRKAIGVEPRAAIYQSSLGVILAKKGDPKGAVAATKRAVDLDPRSAGLHHNYGLALSRDGRTDDAIAEYRRAIALDRRLARSHECLGHLLSVKGEDVEALAELLHAIEIDPRATDAMLGVAVILTRRQEFGEAQAQLRRALEIDPKHVPSLILLSRYEATYGRGKKAEELVRRALEVEPNSPQVVLALGDAQAALGQIDTAKETYARAYELSPQDPQSLISTVGLLWFEGKHSVASDVLDAALKKTPDEPLLMEALAYNLYIEGDTKRSIELAHRAVELEPNRLSSRSLLLALQYQDNTTPREERFNSAIEWNRLASKHHPRMPPAKVDPNPDRPLRVGYVSGCFRGHPVGYVMAPVFAKHDRQAVEHVLYANQVESDDVTTQFRRATKEWYPVTSLTDAELAEKIRDDRIDILVDLAGQSSGHRLEVFLRKPAPIQVTWNWLATTGIQAMDYTICDDVVMPPEEEQWWVERPCRLPGCHVPIPRLHMPTVVGPLPFDRNGYITFACYNNLYKVTDEVIGLWSRILKRLPSSQLVFCMTALQSAKVCDRVRDRFAVHGIREQLILVPGLARLDFLRGYNAVDITLDPFPYNGGMSTLESTFMGVPVVVMQGDSLCSRIGATLATAFGVPELIAHDHDEYVEIAVALANDRDRLSMLRGSLRSRMDRASNPRAFARNLEAAYRGMWHTYLASL